MRTVSDNYNPFPIVRDVDCRISFGVIDQNAKNGTITGNDAGFFPRFAQTVDGKQQIDGKWTSLERNFWVLDGTYTVPPDDMTDSETGWWSSVISGADGSFTAQPYIQYVFSAAISTLGITLRFDDKANQYASDVLLEFLSQSGTVAESHEFTPTSAVAALRHYVGDYYGLRITFRATSEPYRRVRLVECDFGLTQSYTRDTVGSISVKYGLALDMASLPSRELVFTFDNSDKAYNLLNPDGVYQYLQDGQTINLKLLIGGEPVDMGDFFFRSADCTQSAIMPTITAYDRIYLLDGVEYNGGRDAQVTLQAGITELLSGTGITCAYGDGIADRPVHMSIPLGAKVREAVRWLAQAARCVAYIDRDSVLRFEDIALADEECGTITADELYNYSGVSISDTVYGCKLFCNDDFRAGDDGTPGRHVTYTTGDADRAVTYSNPCIADSAGQEVVNWLFAAAKMRKKYAVQNRCDPAVELGDTIRIADAFDNFETGVVTGLDIAFGSSLSAITSAIGV